MQPIDNRTVPDRMVMAQRLIGDMLQTLKFSPHEIQRRMKAAYADKYGQVSGCMGRYGYGRCQMTAADALAFLGVAGADRVP